MLLSVELSKRFKLLGEAYEFTRNGGEREMNTEDRDMYTLQELAARMQMSVSWLRVQIRRGLLQAKYCGREIRIEVEEAKRFRENLPKVQRSSAHLA